MLVIRVLHFHLLLSDSCHKLRFINGDRIKSGTDVTRGFSKEGGHAINSAEGPLTPPIFRTIKSWQAGSQLIIFFWAPPCGFSAKKHGFQGAHDGRPLKSMILVFGQQKPSFLHEIQLFGQTI